MDNFEPQIIGYCCHYCAYTAADLAGSMRLQYPTNIRIIKIPCTGKLNAKYIMEAFASGADGVFAAGWLEGECHFQSGNLRAKKRVGYVKKILAEIGMNPDRAEMYNLSAAQGPRFAALATEFTNRIKELGPSEMKTGKDWVPPKEEEKKKSA